MKKQFLFRTTAYKIHCQLFEAVCAAREQNLDANLENFLAVFEDGSTIIFNGSFAIQENGNYYNAAECQLELMHDQSLVDEYSKHYMEGMYINVKTLVDANGNVGTQYNDGSILWTNGSSFWVNDDNIDGILD